MCDGCHVATTDLTHTDPVPRAKQPPSPEAEAAYRRIVQAQAKLAKLDEQRNDIITERALAVTEALDAGLSLRDIAGRLNLSPERIRQMSLVRAGT